MGDYEIHFEFTRDQYGRMNRTNEKFCLSFGVNQESGNIIAWTPEKLTANVRVHWKDDIQIAVTDHKNRIGCEVDDTLTTAKSIIKPGQKYSLPTGWQDGTVANTTSIYHGSLLFQNNSDAPASAVLYRTVNGTPAPFFMSDCTVMPNENETIQLESWVVLWFQHDAQRSQMVDLEGPDLSIFQLDKVAKLTLKWDGTQFIRDDSD